MICIPTKWKDQQFTYASIIKISLTTLFDKFTFAPYGTYFTTKPRETANMPCMSREDISVTKATRQFMSLEHLFLIEAKATLWDNTFTSSSITYVTQRSGNRIALKDDSRLTVGETPNEDFLHAQQAVKANLIKSFVPCRMSYTEIQKIESVFMHVFEFLPVTDVISLSKVNKFFNSAVEQSQFYAYRTQTLLTKLTLQKDPQVKKIIQKHGPKQFLFHSPVVDLVDNNLDAYLTPIYSEYECSTAILLFRPASNPKSIIPIVIVEGQNIIDASISNYISRPTSTPEFVKSLITDTKNWKCFTDFSIEHLHTYISFINRHRPTIERFIVEYADRSKAETLLGRVTNFLALYNKDSSVVATVDILLGLHIVLSNFRWFGEYSQRIFGKLLDVDFTRLILDSENTAGLKATGEQWKKLFKTEYKIELNDLFNSSKPVIGFDDLDTTFYIDGLFSSLLYLVDNINPNLPLTLTDITTAVNSVHPVRYRDAPVENILWRFMLLHPAQCKHSMLIHTGSIQNMEHIPGPLHWVQIIDPTNGFAITTDSFGTIQLKQIDNSTQQFQSFRYDYKTRRLYDASNRCLHLYNTKSVGTPTRFTSSVTHTSQLRMVQYSSADVAQEVYLKCSKGRFEIQLSQYGSAVCFKQDAGLVAQDHTSYAWMFHGVNASTATTNSTRGNTQQQAIPPAVKKYKIESLGFKNMVITATDTGIILTSSNYTQKDQEWIFTTDGYIQQAHRPRVIDIDFANPNPLASICLYQKLNRSNQKWKVDKDGCIVSLMNGMVLDVDTHDKTLRSIATYPKHGGGNQRWKFIPFNH